MNQDHPRDCLILSLILRWSHWPGCYVLLELFTDQPTGVSVNVVFKTGFMNYYIAINAAKGLPVNIETPHKK